MWQLTCENDLFDGKAIWLRPGSRHLLGRTSARSVGEQVRFINHKNVSRKHLILQVSPNSPGDSSQIHVRSVVTAIDNSKTGTFVNDKQVLKQQIDLDRTENRLQLGNSEYVFHVRWVPVVLTCTNLPKSLKARDDPLAGYRTALEQTDIKLVSSYISNITTHVVAQNRNNPSVLQALAQAKWPVSYEWLDKLSVATQHGANDIDADDHDLSPLQRDLAAEWPQEVDHLVDPGSEPVTREKTLLRPDLRRTEVFSGLSFVFLLQSQYDNLMPVVTACGGKAFVKDYSFSTGNVSDVVNYLNEFSGSKTGRNSDTRLALSKTVVVKPSGRSEDEAQWSRLNDELVSVLGRPTMAQTDFLDIILTLDTTALHLAAADDGMLLDITDKCSRSETEESLKKARIHTQRRRLATQSRFTGFQDIDPSQIARPPSSSPEVQEESSLQHLNSNLGSTDQTRKRNAALLEQDLLGQNSAAPDVSDAKRRRIDSETRQDANQQLGNSTTDAIAANDGRARPPRPEPNVEEMRTKLQAHLQQQEEEYVKREEEMKVKLDELDLEQYNDCAQVEEFAVDLDSHRSHGVLAEHQAGERWNPEWNGRANFKAFRPQGQASNGARRPRVFVQLVEASDDAEDDEHDIWSYNTDAGSSSLSTARAANDAIARTADLSLSASVGEHRQWNKTQSLSISELKRAADIQRSGIAAKRQRQTTLGRSNGRVSMDNDDDDDDDGLQFKRKRRQ